MGRTIQIDEKQKLSEFDSSNHVTLSTGPEDNPQQAQFLEDRAFDFKKEIETTYARLARKYPRYAEYLKAGSTDIENPTKFVSENFSLSPDFYDRKAPETLKEGESIYFNSPEGMDGGIASFISNFNNLSEDQRKSFETAFLNDPARYEVMGDIAQEIMTVTVSPMRSMEGWNVQPGENINRKNSAMSHLAEQLGKPQMFARTETVELRDAENSVKTGILLHPAPGIPLTEHKDLFQQRAHNPLAQPKALHALADLQVMNYIAGASMGFNWNNVTMQTDTENNITDLSIGKLNDSLAFPQVTDHLLKPELLVISRSMAERVSKMSKDSFLSAFAGDQLADSSLENAWKRVENLQKTLQADRNYFEKLPPDAVAEGHIRVVSDDQWGRFNLSGLTRTKENIANNPVDDFNARNTDGLYYENAFTNARSVKDQLNAPVTTLEAPSVSISGRKDITLQAAFPGLIKGVKSADLLFSGSPQYKEMRTALMRMQALTQAPGMTSEAAKEQLDLAAQELQASAQAYLDYRQGMKKIGRSTPARIRMAEEIKRFAGNFIAQRREEQLTALEKKHPLKKPIENLRQEARDLQANYESVRTVAKPDGFEPDFWVQELCQNACEAQERLVPLAACRTLDENGRVAAQKDISQIMAYYRFRNVLADRDKKLAALNTDGMSPEDAAKQKWGVNREVEELMHSMRNEDLNRPAQLLSHQAGFVQQFQNITPDGIGDFLAKEDKAAYTREVARNVQGAVRALPLRHISQRKPDLHAFVNKAPQNNAGEEAPEKKALEKKSGEKLSK